MIASAGRAPGLGLLVVVAGVAAVLAAPAPVHGVPAADPDSVVAEVELVGLDRVDPPLEPPRRLPLRPGRPWSPAREEATEDALADLLSERGHPYALLEVTSREEAPGEMHVVVELLDPGPEVRFGPIQVEAIPPLTEELVRDRLAYAEGDLFQPSLLRLTQERLLREAVVGRALVLPVGLLEGDAAPVTVVSVAPVERPRSPELHGVLSSRRCLEVSGYWRDRFFLGAPRVLSVGGGVGNLFARELDNRFPCSEAGQGEHAGLDYSVEGQVQVPLPGDPLTVLRARAFFDRSSAPPVYVERTFGAVLEGTRELSPSLRASVGYRFQRMDLRAVGVFFCANFGACSGAEVAALAGPRRWAPLEGRLQWLPRRTRLARGGIPGREPRPGPGVGREDRESLEPDLGPLVPEWRPWGQVAVAAAGAATVSEATYGRLTVEGGIGRTVGRRGEMTARARLGGLVRGGDGLLPQTFLFSGGSGSVRGVEANLLGPRVLEAGADGLQALGCQPEPGGCPDGVRATPGEVDVRPRGGTMVAEAGVEGRARLAGWLQVAGFVDGGLVRAPTMALDGGGSRVEGAVTPGVGFRFDTRVGLIRLDLAVDPRGPRRMPVLARWDEALAPGTKPEAGDLVPMGEAVFDPFTHDGPGTLRELARRLHITVGVGQPF